MCELEINILPSGQILIHRSAKISVNNEMYKLLADIVSDKESLYQFLNESNECEQIFGEEPLCG